MYWKVSNGQTLMLTMFFFPTIQTEIWTGIFPSDKTSYPAPSTSTSLSQVQQAQSAHYFNVNPSKVFVHVFNIHSHLLFNKLI